MHKIIRYLAVTFLAIAITGRFVLAQVPTTDNDLKLRISKLHDQADSLRKEARRLQDSLLGKKWDEKFGHFSVDSKGRLLPGDSIIIGSSNGWTQEFPKFFHYEVPDLPEYRFYDRTPNGATEPFIAPKENKKKAPLRGFKGWYIQELADLTD